MPHKSAESLVEERVAQLEAISERRNVLLRQMHQMIRRRDGVASVLTIENQEPEDLALFLTRFRMTPTDTGRSIATLHESELFAPLSSYALQVAPPDSPSTAAARAMPPPPTLNSSSQLGEDERSVPTSPLVASPLSQQSDEDHDELDLLRETSSKPSVTPVQAEVAQPPVSSPEDTAETHARNSTCPISEPYPTQVSLSDIDMEIDVPQLQERSDSIAEVHRNLVGDSPITEDTAMVQDGLSNPRQGGPPSQAPEHTSQNLPGHHQLAVTFDRHDHAVTLHPSPTFAPVVPISSRKSVVITTSTMASPVAPAFAFVDALFSPPASTSTPPSQPRHHFDPNYKMPPAKYLSDTNKKVKATKRKRTEGREKKDHDWAPMGINRWAATIRVNPVWKRVSRAPKCLMTREWAIAMTELRLIRTMDRVEILKDEGRWSFRQPKKQRGVGGLAKTHWDHLMDEMKWMRVDFREERKWKLALAYNLSSAVLEWHAAGSREARLAKGICVHWNVLHLHEESQEAEVAVGEMEVDQSDGGGVMEVDDVSEEQSASLLGVDYGSDDDDDPSKPTEPIVDALHPAEVIKDALDSAATQSMEYESEEPQAAQLKTEQEDTLPLPPGDLVAAPETKSGGEGHAADSAKANLAESALKASSSDPTLGFNLTPSSSGGDPDQSVTPVKTSSKMSAYAPLRQMVFDSDENKLFLDFNDFNTFAEIKLEGDMPPPDLMTLFPEFTPYNILDVTPPMQFNGTEGKKKSEKRSDRDDPYKRSEDVTYTKLFPTGDFMFSKPTLLGPLRPSKNWKNGQWQSPEEPLSISDLENPTKIPEEGINELFDSRSRDAPSNLMYGHLQAAFLRDKDSRRRVIEHQWSAADDALLKSFIDKYPNNWGLIAECYNAARRTIPTDYRFPRDCLDRWRDKWGPDFRRPQDNPGAAEETSAATTSQMTTRGVKRLASANVAGPSVASATTGNEPTKKRRRHAFIQESIRKAGKKRAEALQKQQAAHRKPPAIHETHTQYSKMPKRTPAELSRMKAEKEARDLQEVQLARKRQEEIRGPNFPRDHPQRLNGNVPATPQPQPPGTNSVQRPPMPAIRNQVNISQQQRMGTPSMPVAGNRASPQQVLQVQTNAHFPAMSPPHASPTNSAPLAANSPRPPSAQAHTLLQGATAGTRAGYYMPNVPGYTTEQLHTALRLQHQQQQQAQQTQQQQSPAAQPATNGFPST